MASENIRADVINVVDRYIAVSLVKELNKDAGWRSEHMLGRMADYLGQLPHSQGGGNSNGAMIHQLSMMFAEPDDPHTKWACAAMDLLKLKSERNHDALFGYVLLRNRPDPLVEGSECHTAAAIGRAVEMSRSALYKNLAAAEEFLIKLIDMYEMGGLLKAA
ncbi:hypothetical protein [Neptuniibacter sp.]|uniref:hypothetical protein n=1 Tax=Neptuniibacter sp. TaxID=1962643 RepID=UPI002636E6FA|nr:hypothetical protein [Neptuniibacter sp.]MCP4595738.1 hypothetical protein [Neptuniibacter sp.]